MKQDLMKTSAFAVLALFGFEGVGVTNVAHAQVLTGDENVIVVTATRREQDMQDVGVSVTALSGDQIEELGFTNSTDIVAQSPSVEVRNVWGEFSPNVSVSIRGIAQTDFNDGHESPAVIYVDDFYVLPTAASNFSIYDLQRVETLRGPQGTLFGRNATAGLVHYITRRPSFDAEGYGEFTVSEFDTYRFEGAVNVPFGDTAAFRLSFNTHHTDGHVRNTLLNEDRFQGETYGVRAQFLLEPDDSDTSLLLKAEYSKSNSDYEWQPSTGVFLDADGFIKDIPAGVDFYGTCVQCSAVGSTEDGDLRVNRAGHPTGIDTESVLLQARVEHDFGDIELTSITGFLDFDKGVFEDTTGGTLDVVRAGFYFDTQEITQELRLTDSHGAFRWTAGAFYMHQDAHSDQGALIDGEGLDLFGLFGPGAPLDTAVTGIPVSPVGVDVVWDLEAEAWSLFGQVEFDLSDQVILIGGVRYTHDRKEFEIVRQDFLSASLNGSDPNRPYLNFPNLIPGLFLDGLNFTRNGTPFSIGGPPLAPAGDLTVQKFGNVALKAEIDWRPSDDWLVYASYSRGHKAGGFNNGFIAGAATGATNAGIPYNEEVINAFELGFKSEILDGSTRLNGAVFYYDYNDHQAFSFVGIGNSIDNADGTIYGAELELVTSPFDGLELLLGASLLETELRDVSNAGGIIFDGEFGLAPKFTANGVARYEWDALGGTMAIQGDFNHVGERFSSALNSPAYVLEEYTLFNARASFTTGNDLLRIAVFAKNIGNTRPAVYKSELNAFGGASGNIYMPPRQIGASLTLSF